MSAGIGKGNVLHMVGRGKTTEKTSGKVVVMGTRVLVDEVVRDNDIIIPENVKSKPVRHADYFIKEVGPDVKKLKVGDRVILTGINPASAGHFLVRCDDGDGEKNYLLLPEEMIGAVQR